MKALILSFNRVPIKPLKKNLVYADYQKNNSTTVGPHYNALDKFIIFLKPQSTVPDVDGCVVANSLTSIYPYTKAYRLSNICLVLDRTKQNKIPSFVARDFKACSKNLTKQANFSSINFPQQLVQCKLINNENFVCRLKGTCRNWHTNNTHLAYIFIDYSAYIDFLSMQFQRDSFSRFCKVTGVSNIKQQLHQLDITSVLKNKRLLLKKSMQNASSTYQLISRLAQTSQNPLKIKNSLPTLHQVITQPCIKQVTVVRTLHTSAVQMMPPGTGAEVWSAAIQTSRALASSPGASIMPSAITGAIIGSSSLTATKSFVSAPRPRINRIVDREWLYQTNVLTKLPPSLPSKSLIAATTSGESKVLANIWAVIPRLPAAKARSFKTSLQVCYLPVPNLGSGGLQSAASRSFAYNTVWNLTNGTFVEDIASCSSSAAYPADKSKLGGKIGIEVQREAPVIPEDSVIYAIKTASLNEDSFVLVPTIIFKSPLRNLMLQTTYEALNNAAFVAGPKQVQSTLVSTLRRSLKPSGTVSADPTNLFSADPDDVLFAEFISVFGNLAKGAITGHQLLDVRIKLRKLYDIELDFARRARIYDIQTLFEKAALITKDNPSAIISTEALIRLMRGLDELLPSFFPARGSVITTAVQNTLEHVIVNYPKAALYWRGINWVLLVYSVYKAHETISDKIQLAAPEFFQQHLSPVGYKLAVYLSNSDNTPLLIQLLCKWTDC